MKFVGIDLHKVNCQMCALDDVTGEVQEKRIPTSVSSLHAYFNGWARCRILIEAATESEWVARVLERMRHFVVVANPNFAPMYATLDKKITTDTDIIPAETTRLQPRGGSGSPGRPPVSFTRPQRHTTPIRPRLSRLTGTRAPRASDDRNPALRDDRFHAAISTE